MKEESKDIARRQDKYASLCSRNDKDLEMDKEHEEGNGQRTHDRQLATPLLLFDWRVDAQKASRMKRVNVVHAIERALGISQHGVVVNWNSADLLQH